MEPHRTVFRELDLTPELLGQQGRALRGLARSLLGDAHAAEDVVQETWLACLKHPGVLPERVSAWLATVTKHLALHRRRGERRLRAREARAASPERLEALQQRSMEREEALRAVTQALLALEEPFKTALLLRYYEDRSAAEIASELGEPLSTVKSRLARGLEKLRAKLGREFAGDERRETRALCALAGLPAPAAWIGGGAGVGAAGTKIGALAMGVKLQAVAAALVLAGGALWWWNRDDARAPYRGEERAAVPETGALVASGPASGAPAAVAQAAPGATAQQREALAPAAVEPVAPEVFPPEAAYRYSIKGQVRDENDEPLAGAHVFLAPHLFPFNRAAETDENGCFALAFEARRASLDCALAVGDGGGRLLGPCDLHLVAGQELVVDVGLNGVADRGTLIVDMRAAEGERAALARVRSVAGEGVEAPEGEQESTVEVSYDRFAFATRASGPLERAPEMVPGAGGLARFVDPPPHQACTRPPEVVAIEDSSYEALSGLEQAFFVRAGVQGLSLSFDGALSYALADLVVNGQPPAEPAPRAKVRGVVRDALGNPVAGARVGCGPQGHALAQSADSDENGRFELGELEPGELVLRAGGGDLGRASEHVTLAPGQELAWNPLLERGDEVTGRIVRAGDGQGLAGVLVELWSASATSLWSDSTVTNEDGRFALPNVPPGTFELHVFASGAAGPPSAFPVRVLRPVFPRSDLGEIALAEADLAVHTLRVALRDSHGEPLPDAEVRVWQTATGRGAFAGEPGEGGKCALSGLPAGAYRVEAGGVLGWRDLGTVWIDEDMDLGEVRFADAGLALFAFEPASGLAHVATSLWSAHPDVFGRAEARDELAGTASAALREGPYVLCVRAGEERRSAAPLDVRSGQASGLRVLGPERGAPELRAEALVLGPAGELAAARCSACHAAEPGR